MVLTSQLTHPGIATLYLTASQIIFFPVLKIAAVDVLGRPYESIKNCANSFVRQDEGKLIRRCRQRLRVLLASNILIQNSDATPL